ncbi:YwdI family protein [Cytobacillus gottheilii]|uniref:YwdI family protein n=1 Tax=Cytobacillus gottheilii TaxID=859144 RepID=UPI00214789C6|nr:YwdI family protein [Cytobacillus gottheilii]
MKNLSISIQQLLGKMEKELKEAKGLSQSSLVRERVHAIKSICELILENGGEKTQQLSSMPVSYSVPVSQPQPMPQILPQNPAPAIQPAKRLEMEDEANGDSLFDF